MFSQSHTYTTIPSSSSSTTGASPGAGPAPDSSLPLSLSRNMSKAQLRDILNSESNSSDKQDVKMMPGAVPYHADVTDNKRARFEIFKCFAHIVYDETISETQKTKNPGFKNHVIIKRMKWTKIKTSSQHYPKFFYNWNVTINPNLQPNRATLWEMNKTLRISKKRFQQGQQNNSRKELFHALRFIRFAVQIAKHGKIEGTKTHRRYYT